MLAMALFDFWSALFNTRYVGVVAAEVAQTAHDSVWTLVSVRVHTLGEAEAKGYTRARAMPVVQELAAEAIRQSPHLGDWAQTDLVEQSLKLLADDIWERVDHLRQSQRRRAA
jgi:hypothetical protein